MNMNKEFKESRECKKQLPADAIHSQACSSPDQLVDKNNREKLLGES
jgi:hypothetical protein